jgi:hypothetical protein
MTSYKICQLLIHKICPNNLTINNNNNNNNNSNIKIIKKIINIIFVLKTQ